MYGTGLYPEYGYNQQGSLGSLLNSISQSINAGYAYYTGQPAAPQPTLFNTYNQGAFSGNSGLVLVGLAIVVIVLLVK